LPRKDPEQRKLYFKEYYLKHQKTTKINVEAVEADVIATNEPNEPIDTNEPNDTNKPIEPIETSNLTSHVKQPEQQNHIIMNIPLKLKEKILRSKLLRINEFVLKEVSAGPLYLDILADEYKYNLSSTLGALAFVKFLESYFGRFFCYDLFFICSNMNLNYICILFQLRK